MAQWSVRVVGAGRGRCRLWPVLLWSVPLWPVPLWSVPLWSVAVVVAVVAGAVVAGVGVGFTPPLWTLKRPAGWMSCHPPTS